MTNHKKLINNYNTRLEELKVDTPAIKLKKNRRSINTMNTIISKTKDLNIDIINLEWQNPSGIFIYRPDATCTFRVVDAPEFLFELEFYANKKDNTFNMYIRTIPAITTDNMCAESLYAECISDLNNIDVITIIDFINYVVNNPIKIKYLCYYGSADTMEYNPDYRVNISKKDIKNITKIEKKIIKYNYNSWIKDLKTLKFIDTKILPRIKNFDATVLYDPDYFTSFSIELRCKDNTSYTKTDILLYEQLYYLIDLFKGVEKYNKKYNDTIDIKLYYWDIEKEQMVFSYLEDFLNEYDEMYFN